MRALVVIPLLLAALGCACSPADRVALRHDGESRNYWLYVPDGVSEPAPLLLVLHGGGPRGSNKGRGVARFTGLSAKADAEGFVVAFPSSLAGNWNDGRELDTYVDPATDDVGFVEAVIDDIAGRVEIDVTRVSVSGVSNGGFMTQRLACERPTRFAAAVSFIATMPATLSCAPSVPIPVMFVVGTEDPLVPYEGGPVASGGRGEAVSADAATAFWTTHNGCTGEPSRVDLPDADPQDGTRVIQEDGTGCAASVSRLIIDGGGHTWPGGSQYLPVRTIGRVSRDVNGEDVLWDFVKSETR